jgi:LPXTG-motif cell wall-anchored protein
VVALTMRIVFNVLGGLLLLAGGVWFLQGINILPGSFMTGQTKWAVYGGLLMVAGIGLLFFVNRRRRDGA